MQSPDAPLPLVSLPAPVDRRVRLGPFPSARDALKFATYAATGAVLAPFASPFAWVPVVAIGFGVSVWRPDGEAVDERAARVVLFHARQWTGRPLTRRGSFPTTRGPVVRLVGMFDRFRELLRATEGPLFLLATSVPLRAAPVRPPKNPGSGVDAAARIGYVDLVTVLCRRRRTRRVDIALRSTVASEDGDRRLLERARALSEQLAGLGLAPVTLTDRGLHDAVRGYGWLIGGGPE
jgi:hypothetical protein